jgi:hypothetical protein
MSERDERSLYAPASTKTLEQSTALRGWLTALLAQTVQAEAAIKYRVVDLETEAGRLRGHLDQTTAAIETLRQSIRTVDETIGRRLMEHRASEALGHPSERRERSVEEPSQNPGQAGHESRRERRQGRRE